MRAEAAVAVSQIAEEARIVVLATHAVLRPRRPVPAPVGPGEEGDTFWYAGASPVLLWWRRLRCHLSLRSVYLQNALRLGVGLALARLVAGELDVAHGFWVLLATLTLMRTSAASTRAALPPALLGTTIGGALAIGLGAVRGPVPDRDGGPAAGRRGGGGRLRAARGGGRVAGLLHPRRRRALRAARAARRGRSGPSGCSTSSSGPRSGSSSGSRCGPPGGTVRSAGPRPSGSPTPRTSSTAPPPGSRGRRRVGWCPSGSPRRR